MIGYSLSLLVAAIIPHLSGENESPGFTKNKNETLISLSPSNLTELYFGIMITGPRKAALSSCL